MAEIETRLGTVLIDDEDLPILKGRKVRTLRNSHGRIFAAIDWTPLGRVLMGAEKGQTVDHINRNPLDNRRANLRFADLSQQQFNRVAPRRKNPYRGVWAHPSGNFTALIQAYGKRYYLGSSKDPEACARLYDEAAKRLHGEFAVLNFPEPNAA